ncbi:MAG TPA: hypothetical protein VFX53_05085 [Pedococcus sp.]|nr:hypothetical protein [Pedococcus sp.]
MSAFTDRTRVALDGLPAITVNVSGSGINGLGQYAGREAHRWARANGYRITERLYTSVDNAYGFAAGVESRYRVEKMP